MVGENGFCNMFRNSVVLFNGNNWGLFNYW